MTILYFLRALSELGVYYTLAGTAAALFGGQLQLELLLLQSACFALSGVLRERKGPRLAALLPCFLLLLLPGPMADRLLALPPAVYLAYLAWADSYLKQEGSHTGIMTVGAGHMVGRTGIVQGLKDLGYTVEVVPAP